MGKSLADLPTPSEWTKTIEKLQELEKQKLEETVRMQMLKAHFTVMKKDDFNPTFIDNCRQIRATLASIIEEINDILLEARCVVTGES